MEKYKCRISRVTISNFCIAMSRQASFFFVFKHRIQRVNTDEKVSVEEPIDNASKDASSIERENREERENGDDAGKYHEWLDLAVIALLI